MAIHIKDKEDFSARLAEAGNKLVIVDFHATWCGPCKFISPKLEELLAKNEGAVIVLKVDVDECQELAEEYNISSMPTFIFIKGNKKIAEFSGADVQKLAATVAMYK